MPRHAHVTSLISPTFTLLPFSLALMAATAAHAADPPGGPPDDLDALSLADKAPTAAPEAPKKWRIFVEAAGGTAHRSDNGDRIDTGRLSADIRFDSTIAPGLRAVLSDRLDLVRDNDKPGNKDVNTLREAYLSWSPASDRVFDLGRVNVRHGVAYGYNPTDWFKENALRSIVSLDPAVLRENRQGTFVLQGQKLWTNASLTAALSPKLGSTQSSASYTFDAGATNPRNRWLLAGSYKFNDKLNPELLLYGGDDTPTQLGFNVSTLLGGSAVVFGEFTTGKGRSLIAQAINPSLPEHNQNRASIGITYTAPFNLTVTAEAERNTAGATRDQWNALIGINPLAPLQVLGTANALQDLPVRRAWFLHATWKDLLVRRLDVSGFVRREAETKSRAQWLELRYRWDRADLAVQWQVFSGDPGSVYATVPRPRAVEMALRFYL